MQTETHCGIEPLTDKEIDELIQDESNNMGPEITFEYMCDVVKASEDALKEHTRLEKIIYLVHCAYISGFSKAINLYNDSLREELREKGEFVG